ncbi:MAG: anthranilate synthase component I family protein [Chitinophagaceae bacterium]|nr:MAG: anthranilate synthase component I family protein [Chitinophagaceae bacterium]
MIQEASFTVPTDFNLRKFVLNESQKHNYFCVFSSSDLESDIYREYDFLIAVGCQKKIELFNGENSFEKLNHFVSNAKLKVFGVLSYDLKNEIYPGYFSSQKNTFPHLAFFEPLTLISKKVNSNTVSIQTYSSEKKDYFINKLQTPDIQSEADANPQTSNIDAPFKCNFTKEEYTATVNSIKNDLESGDIYELNLCLEFSSQMKRFNSGRIFLTLNEMSPSPFSALFSFGDYKLISSSPERYLKNKNGHLVAQPIKGTRQRSADFYTDERLKDELREDKKEIAENVMIVDLMRNDLAKVAQAGSIEVPELFKIYSFKHVHQMISTITATLDENKFQWSDAVKASFPMGSMTGAPKLRAMERIELYEKNDRKWYSGALGYISPNGSFDLSVVIRSILYDAQSERMSFQAGSAITWDALAENEWEECLLKAEAMKKAIQRSL